MPLVPAVKQLRSYELCLVTDSSYVVDVEGRALVQVYRPACWQGNTYIPMAAVHVHLPLYVFNAAVLLNVLIGCCVLTAARTHKFASLPLASEENS